MIENMKLFPGSCCDSSFPADSSEHCILAKLNVFSYFCLLSMTVLKLPHSKYQES